MVSSLAGRRRVACDSQELAELEGSSLNGHIGESASPEELFVSGRLAVFGEHSDWAGAMRRQNPCIAKGRTIVIGTSQGLYARAHALLENVLEIRTTTECGQVFGPVRLPLDPQLLIEEAQRGGFWSYVAGTAAKIMTEHEVRGLAIDNHTTTLPLRKGLSSSAAICVLVARAFNRIYNLRLSTRGEMQAAYEGERLTPSLCGKMDQACAFGCRPVEMTYDGDVLHVAPIALAAPLHFVLVDLRAAKDTIIILSRLQAAYPHPADERERALHELLGAVNESITGRAVAAMERGDAAAIGAPPRPAPPS